MGTTKANINNYSIYQCKILFIQIGNTIHHLYKLKFSAMIKSFHTFYVKLQDAYLAEKGDSLGSWRQIGYNMFNNSNFDYYEDGTIVGDKGYVADNNGEALATGKANAWGARNKATLNDCAINSSANNWNLAVTNNTEIGGSAVYEAKAASTDCGALTPSFEKLTTKK